MIVENPEDYCLIGFRKASNPRKKYEGVLVSFSDGHRKYVPFGDTRYHHFKDTALGLYKHLDHLSFHRRASYHQRHANDQKNKFSSGWFSAKYLW
jgi:hypothetical protein